MSAAETRRRVLAWAPAAVVATLALASAPAQVRAALERLKESPRGIARGEEAARRELRGGAYADAVAEAAARIPAGGSYAIADEGAKGPDANWIRCDLAPRTPILFREEGCGRWDRDRRFAPIPDVTVLVSVDGSARVVETSAILTSLWSGLAGPESEITGWLDEPAEGRTVVGRFLVGGWCQEKGGRPCAVRLWVDGVEVDPARIERFPRPGLAAAFPGIGDPSRAGWRAAFEPGVLAPGRHCVAAALIAAGGRHRRIGPWAFTVAP